MSETGRLEVYVDDVILDAWTSVRVRRSIEQLASEFEIAFARAPGGPTDSPLLKGSRVQVLVDDELVLSGHVDRRRVAYDGTSHELEVAGRDRVADLVDCAAVVLPGQWSGARVASIASDIVGTFPGLRFREDLSVPELGSLATFALESGESAWKALDRIGRMRGLILRPDVDGGVYYTRPGRERAPVALEQGANVEGGRIESSDADRFSRYVVQGQNTAPEGWTEAAGASVQAEATDPAVSRYRPLVVQAESSASIGELEQRARFEASVRAARSERVYYTLPGWRLAGYLWNPGDLVAVFDPDLGIGGASDSPVDLLVGGVSWDTSANGPTTSSVELYQPGAFSTLPVQEPETEGLEYWLPQT